VAAVALQCTHAFPPTRPSARVSAYDATPTTKDACPPSARLIEGGRTFVRVRSVRVCVYEHVRSEEMKLKPKCRKRAKGHLDRTETPYETAACTTYGII